MTNIGNETTPQPTDNPFDRLEKIKNIQGFLPTTYREISEAYALRNGGTDLHLDDILHHQESAQTDDPTKAVISVTNEYVSFFKAARLSLTHLNLLSIDIDDTNNSPGLTLVDATGTTIGYGDLVRFIDLSRLVKDKEITQGEIDPLTVDYFLKPSPQTVAHIMKVLRDLRISDARGIIPLAIDDQYKRALFWHERLDESRGQYLSRPIAEAALRTNIEPEPEN
jgi:hypothetical protein